MKGNFRTAFDAKKSAEEPSQWGYVLFLIVTNALWNLLEEGLIANYSFSRLKSFLISGAVMLLAVFVFVRIKHAIRGRRNQQANR